MGFKLPTYGNPADYYMRILGVNFPKTEKDERKLKFLNSGYETHLTESIKEESRMITLPAIEMDKFDNKNASLCTELK